MALPPDRCIACKTQSLVSAEEMPNHVASKHPEFAFKCGPCASQVMLEEKGYFFYCGSYISIVNIHKFSGPPFITSMFQC